MINKKYYRCDRCEMTALLPKEYSRVLEIGCGEGNFRKNLNQINEYWGVELVESVGTIAAQNLDHVLIGAYEKISTQIPNNYFDLVICNDVIEHMTDHDDFFHSIKDKITKHGFLVASIPNVRYQLNLYNLLVNKDWQYTDAGILDKTHLRFFTKKSILKTVISHGFMVEECIGINSYWYKQFLKRCVYYAARKLLGEDIMYLQFGIRIRNS